MIPLYQGDYGDKRLVALVKTHEEAEEFMDFVNSDPMCLEQFHTDREPVYVNDREEMPALDIEKFRAGWRNYLVMIDDKITVQMVLKLRPDYEAPGVLQKVVFAQTSKDAIVQVLTIWESKNGPFALVPHKIAAST